MCFSDNNYRTDPLFFSVILVDNPAFLCFRFLHLLFSGGPKLEIVKRFIKKIKDH